MFLFVLVIRALHIFLGKDIEELNQTSVLFTQVRLERSVCV